MQKMSGIDLAFAVAEMQPLCGKRIARIRETGAGVFLVKIGTGELLFQPGARLHLTRQQLQAAEKPSGFVSWLRRNFEGKTAQAIAQVPHERIVEITTKSKERLVFELFRKGNLIAVGEDGTIAACLTRDEAGGRRIARGGKYAYPKATPFAQKAPENPSFLVQGKEGAPVSYSCDAAAGGREFPSFSEMADHYYSNAREESAAQRAAGERMASLEARLASQKEALLRLGEERKALRQEGDAIFSDCERIDGIIGTVRGMKREGASEEEVNRKIAKFNARVAGAKIELS